jgi:hypothetical protein
MVHKKGIANSTWLEIHVISEIWFMESIAHIRWTGGHVILEIYVFADITCGKNHEILAIGCWLLLILHGSVTYNSNFI